MLQLGLQRQADTVPEQRPTVYQHYPGCGRGLSAEDDEDVEPRIVQTRAGEVQWQEPKQYCRHCRQAFFPQSKNLGLDRSRYSNAGTAKVLYAGSKSTSYRQAQNALQQLAELDVSDGAAYQA